MHELVTPEHAAAAARFRRAQALIDANRDLVLMGAYAPGHDAALDAALAAREAMEAFRAQPRDAAAGFAASVEALMTVAP
jgi:flagellum-specific ATP synthase